MKREHVIIFFLVVFIIGYGWGRMSGRPTAASAAVAAAAAPANVSANSSEAPAPTPAPTPTPAPASAAPAQAAAAPAAAPAQNNAPSDPNQIWRAKLEADDAKKGPDSALVKVVVFGAFGNQESADFAPAIDEVIKIYGDKIQVRFKHKVIPSPHPDAMLGSEAALAANAQGKFWQFLSKQLKNPAISRATLEATAQEVGCDMAKFKKDLDSGKFRSQIMRDSLLANEVAANTYPNAMANGVRMAQPKKLEQLKALIDEQLVKAKEKVKNGQNAATLYDDAIRGGKFFEQMGSTPNKIDTTGSPMLGPKTAKIEVEVYEDFQCPFCSKVAQPLHEFQQKFPNDVRIVYKHMPLDIHDHAQMASEASMAAMAQGKFWEYHDKLYANQQALDRPQLEQYAQDIGLDVAKFKADLDKGVGRDTISRDANEGRNVGVTGTPSIYMNGVKFQVQRGNTAEGFEAAARAYFGLGK